MKTEPEQSHDFASLYRRDFAEYGTRALWNNFVAVNLCCASRSAISWASRSAYSERSRSAVSVGVWHDAMPFLQELLQHVFEKPLRQSAVQDSLRARGGTPRSIPRAAFRCPGADTNVLGGWLTRHTSAPQGFGLSEDHAAAECERALREQHGFKVFDRGREIGLMQKARWLVSP
jgi:hypothetical protein